MATLLPGAPAGEHLAVAHAYKEVFVRLRRQPNYHEPLFPGAREALAALAGDGWLLGIATGKSRRGLVQVIEHHGLGGLFVTTQTADDHPGKPDPAMLRRAMADCGVEPAAAVMIGDTTYDMAMARAASVAAIGVGWGCHPLAELEDAGAVAVVDDFGLLPPLLAGLIRSGAGPRRDRAREDRQCV